MTREEVYQELSDIIKNLKSQDFEVHPNLSVQKDFAEDSIELMDFIITVEDTFNVEINDEQIDKLQTLNDLLDFILIQES